jgi:hypothetical protein
VRQAETGMTNDDLDLALLWTVPPKMKMKREDRRQPHP